MTSINTPPAALSLADRKAQLLLQGEIHRLGLLKAQMTVMQSLNAQTLVQRAVEQVLGFAGNRVVAMAGGEGISPAALIPLAANAFSFLSRKKLLKPLIGMGIVAGTLCAATVAWSRYKASSSPD